MDPIKAATLAREFEGGSKAAFGELYDAYLKQIYNFIYYKTHNKETAEEITSEVFLKAYKSVASYRSEKGTFQAWIYQIARHAIIDYYRSAKKTVDIEDVWDLGSKEDLARDVENRILLEKVQEYLKELTAEQRDIIIMRIWQDMSYAEIAEVLGKSEASCKMMFGRSIQKLRAAMPEALLLMVLSLVVKNKII